MSNNLESGQSVQTSFVDMPDRDLQNQLGLVWAGSMRFAINSELDRIGNSNPDRKLELEEAEQELATASDVEEIKSIAEKYNIELKLTDKQAQELAGSHAESLREQNLKGVDLSPGEIIQ